MTVEDEQRIWAQYGEYMKDGIMRHGQAIMNACRDVIPNFDFNSIPIDVWEKDYSYAALDYMSEVRKVYA